MTFKVEREIGGKMLSIEVGKLAKQAHGAATVQYGDTILLGTVVTGTPRPGIDFFPLTVDFREKLSAAGKFPGGFFKREGRPTNKEILTMRMIDRPVRPLFADGFKDEVQIQIMVISADLENETDILGMIAASAALSIAPLPFNGPIGATRVARVDGKFIINPTVSQLEYSDMDMVLSGTLGAVNMIEVGAREVPDDIVAEAVKYGHENGVAPVVEMLDELKRQCGQECPWTPPEVDEGFLRKIDDLYRSKMGEARSIAEKQERYDAVKAIRTEAIEHFCPEGAEQPEHDEAAVKEAIQKLEKSIIRENILKHGKRSDGRKLDEVRPLEMEVGWLPRTHGSTLFARGQTQAMVTATLGTPRDEQTVDELMSYYSKKFMLHYNFPPFSVGEARRIMGPGRRELGHGALAERSLEAVLPSPDDFPYTIRLVSDILESNGSSSMASVCGGSLAMMDAGVPISNQVAGISIGLIEDNGRFAFLTDILGEEDHFGDMDFKVAGTKDGVTGVQLDLKKNGLTHEQIKETFKLARKALTHILGKMNEVIDKPRSEISQYAPRILILKVDPEKIGKIIGPGGKGIKGIEASTGASVNIEDDGTVTVSCVDRDGAERAKAAIEAIAEDVKVGRIYQGKVISIKDFGAFIELAPGQDGLCHISELDDNYVKNVTDVVKMGEIVRVKVIAVDDQGRVKLSRKAAMKDGSDESES